MTPYLVGGGEGAPSDMVPSPIPPYPAGAVLERLTNCNHTKTQSPSGLRICPDSCGVLIISGCGVLIISDPLLENPSSLLVLLTCEAEGIPREGFG